MTTRFALATRNKLFLAALSLCLVAAGLVYYKYRVAPALNVTGLELYTLDGQRVSLHKHPKHGTFVNFFATWCGPCMSEMPLLYETQTLLAHKKVLFVYVSDEPVARLKVFERQTQGNMLILHSPKKLSQLGIHTIPTSYLLNSNLKVVFNETGELETDATKLAGELNALLQ